MGFGIIRFASRLGGALVLVTVGLGAAAQPPKEQPKNPAKEPAKEQPKDAPPSPDEEKAKEAFRAGKLDETLKFLQAAAKTNPNLGPPKVVVSRWCLDSNQGEQARILLEQAAFEDPGHPDVYLTNAFYAIREGRLTDAILSCNNALVAADNPRWDAEAKKRFQREAHSGLAAAYEMRTDFASVKTHLQALLQADPRNAQLRQRLARANFLINHPEDAFADFQAAFKDDPTLDPPELAMAQLWTGKQDFPKADEWFAKAVKAHGNSAKVHRGYTGYLLDRGNIAAARDHLTAAKKLEPDALDTKALEGLVARYAKDYKTAEPIFEELVRNHPTYRNGFATANLALVLAETGDMKGKQRAVDQATLYVQQNPRVAEARAIYAYCLFKAGRTADADRAMREAVTLGALPPDGAYFVAKVLADRGQIEDAHKVAKAAVENQGGAAYRNEAKALLAELEKKLPPKKDEKK